MYYLTYRDLDKGFLFNLGRPVTRIGVMNESNSLFREFGSFGRVMVIVRDQDDVICDKRYAPEYL